MIRAHSFHNTFGAFTFSQLCAYLRLARNDSDTIFTTMRTLIADEWPHVNCNLHTTILSSAARFHGKQPKITTNKPAILSAVIATRMSFIYMFMNSIFAINRSHCLIIWRISDKESDTVTTKNNRTGPRWKL